MSLKEVKMINPYNVLGVSQSSDYNSIRKKYILLAKKYHPDNFASSTKISEEKMKIINNAFNLIKETIHHKIVHIYHKGKFTQAEINEVVFRYNKGQSFNKMAREMDRSREAIRRHLIRLGYVDEPVKRETVVTQTHWYDILIPSWHTALFVFMTMAIIISGLYMGLMCFALICLISD